MTSSESILVAVAIGIIILLAIGYTLLKVYQSALTNYPKTIGLLTLVVAGLVISWPLVLKGIYLDKFGTAEDFLDEVDGMDTRQDQIDWLNLTIQKFPSDGRPYFRLAKLIKEGKETDRNKEKYHELILKSTQLEFYDAQVEVARNNWVGKANHLSKQQSKKLNEDLSKISNSEVSWLRANYYLGLKDTTRAIEFLAENPKHKTRTFQKVARYKLCEIYAAYVNEKHQQCDDKGYVKYADLLDSECISKDVVNLDKVQLNSKPKRKLQCVQELKKLTINRGFSGVNRYYLGSKNPDIKEINLYPVILDSLKTNQRDIRLMLQYRPENYEEFKDPRKMEIEIVVDYEKYKLPYLYKTGFKQDLIEFGRGEIVYRQDSLLSLMSKIANGNDVNLRFSNKSITLGLSEKKAIGESIEFLRTIDKCRQLLTEDLCPLNPLQEVETSISKALEKLNDAGDLFKKVGDISFDNTESDSKVKAEFECQTDRLKVVISDKATSYTYNAWTKEDGELERSLALNDGLYVIHKQGECKVKSWTFSNGEYQYKAKSKLCDLAVTNSVTVFKSDKEIQTIQCN